MTPRWRHSLRRASTTSTRGSRWSSLRVRRCARSSPHERNGAHGDRLVSETPLFETASDAEAVSRAVAAAAPTVERADQAAVSTLDPALREPVRLLLTSLADNKYVLGRRYAEWCTGAPLLESAV